MATRRLSGIASSSSVPDNGGDHSGGGGSAGGYVDDVFSTYVYTGTGADQTIENGIDLDGEGGLVWVKSRATAFAHFLCDTERGPNNKLETQGQQGEVFKESINGFTNSGFSVAGSSLETNNNGDGLTSWTFRKAPKFFDVVTYTGNGTDKHEIFHNLGCEPGMIITKSISQTSDWITWHRKDGVSSIKTIWLNKSDAANNGMSPIKKVTDKSFQLDNYSTPSYNNNVAGQEYVAYLFAHDDSDESMIKCGTFSYDGSNPSEVDLGFEPQWVLVKAVDVSDQWYLSDAIRGLPAGGIGQTALLYPNTTDAEYGVSSRYNLGLSSTGFVMGAGAPTARNYIYVAIRRPNKPAEEFEPEELFAVTPSTNTNPRYVSGFPVDMGIRRFVTDSSGNYIHSRLTGNFRLSTSTTGQESASDDAWMDYNNGMTAPDYVAPDANRLAWMWRRAPGFFDVVCYEGDNSGDLELKHSLGVKPEMLWLKPRSSGDAYSGNWHVWHTVFGNDQLSSHLNLNTNGSLSGAIGVNPVNSFASDGISPIIRGGGSGEHNKAGVSYIAYLFASAPGISKVGSYEGNGSNDGPTVECGFVPRMVMVKNMGGNGSWELMDSVRGFTNIISLNNENVQIFDSLVEATTSGFKVTNGAGNVNTAGQNYLFYAIA